MVEMTENQIHCGLNKTKQSIKGNALIYLTKRCRDELASDVT
jgi:hypothetical protein